MSGNVNVSSLRLLTKFVAAQEVYSEQALSQAKQERTIVIHAMAALLTEVWQENVAIAP